MNNWHECELGSVVTLKRGYDLPQQKRIDGNVPIFSSSGISGYHNTPMVSAPGVITGRYGTIGQVFFSSIDYWPLNTTLYVEDFHGNDPLFIYFFLKTIQWEKYQSASAVPGINRNAVHTEIVSIPDKETQGQIADILAVLDRKIKNSQQINDNLYQQAMALFTETFLTYPFEGESIPLYDFADYINGAAFKPADYSEDGLPIIKIAELKNGITDSTQRYNGDKGEKYIIHDKDILFSWSGNPDTSIDIFIWCGGKAILNQHTFNVKSKEGIRWFIYLMLKYFKPQFSQIASNKQTTGLGHVTAADLKRLTFPYDREQILSFEEGNAWTWMSTAGRWPACTRPPLTRRRWMKRPWPTSRWRTSSTLSVKAWTSLRSSSPSTTSRRTEPVPFRLCAGTGA